jgi:hypothetical protein
MINLAPEGPKLTLPADFSRTQPGGNPFSEAKLVENVLVFSPRSGGQLVLIGLQSVHVWACPNGKAAKNNVERNCCEDFMVVVVEDFLDVSIKGEWGVEEKVGERREDLYVVHCEGLRHNKLKQI